MRITLSTLFPSILNVPPESTVPHNARAKSKSTQTRGFISYKTEPDLEKAKFVAADLQERGVTVHFISGESLCPFPQGTPEAEAWITRLLDNQTSNILISIASQESMRSKWVLHEFWRGFSSSEIILLLWVSGPNPTPHFIPVSRPLTRWLPTPATTYLVDCRENINEGIDVSEQAITQFAAIRKNRSLRRFLSIVGCLGLSALPLYFFFIGGSSADPAANADSAVIEKTVIGAWLVLIFTLAAVIFPTAYKLPARATNHPRIERITAGFSLNRWCGVVWCLTTILTSRAWGAIPSGIFGAVVSVVANLIGKSFLANLVLRSYRKADSE
jgi:hypothetical protein